MKVDDRKFVNAYFPWNEDLAREAKSEKPHYDPVKEKPVEMAKFEYSIEIACALDDLNSYQVGAFSLRQTKEETNISSWKKSQNDKGFTVLTASVKVNEPKTLTREFFISSGNGVSFNEVKPVKKGDGSSSESFVPIKPSIQIYNRLSWPKVGFFYHFINDELENEYQLSGGNKWSFKVTNSKGKTLSDELLSEHEYAFILLPWKIDNTVISRQHLLYTKEKITPEQFSDINAQWLDENARLINPEDVIKARNDEKIKREISDNGRVVYTVKSGDSLSLIAKNQGVKYENLLTLNPQITDPNLIQVGDLITLKEEKTEQEIVMFHVCKINPETEQRETWGEIAAQYGMAAKALFDLNTNNPMFKDGALALGNELLVNQDVQSEKEDIVYRNAQSPESITSDKSVFSFSNIWSVIEQPYSTLAYMFAQNDAAISNNTTVVNVKSVLLHSNILATSESLELIAQGKAPTLKKGDNGNAVKVIQEALLALNFDLGKYGADGNFGSGTHQAVMDFQREFEPTHEIHDEYEIKNPDGIIDSQTLLAIDEASVIHWEVKSKCLCNKPIPRDMLSKILSDKRMDNGIFERSISPKLKNTKVDDFLEQLNLAFTRYQITSCLQKIHFLSQVLIESDFFKTAEEYKNKDGSTPSHWNSYEGGHTYHGRGLIQVTHNYNYDEYWAHNGRVLENSAISNDLYHVIDSSLWYWTKGSAWGNINSFADNNDFLKVTIAVNGGFNHVSERMEALMNLSKAISCKNVDYNRLVFDKYSFEESSLKTTKWYKKNPLTVKDTEEKTNK